MAYHTKNRMFVPMFDVIGTILLTTNLTFYESFKALLLFAVACHHHDFFTDGNGIKACIHK